MLGVDVEHEDMYGEVRLGERHGRMGLQLVKEVVRCPQVDRGCCGSICQQGHAGRWCRSIPE